MFRLLSPPSTWQETRFTCVLTRLLGGRVRTGHPDGGLGGDKGGPVPPQIPLHIPLGLNKSDGRTDLGLDGIPNPMTC